MSYETAARMMFPVLIIVMVWACRVYIVESSKITGGQIVRSLSDAARTMSITLSANVTAFTAAAMQAAVSAQEFENTVRAVGEVTRSAGYTVPYTQAAGSGGRPRPWIMSPSGASCDCAECRPDPAVLDGAYDVHAHADYGATYQNDDGAGAAMIEELLGDLPEPDSMVGRIDRATEAIDRVLSDEPQLDHDYRNGNTWVDTSFLDPEVDQDPDAPYARFDGPE